MEEHGKVIWLSAVRQGCSQKTGENWSALDFVLEMDGRYIRRVKFSLFGEERIRRAALQIGDYVTARFEIEAHFFKEDYFNDLRCYDIIKNGVSLLR